MTLLSLIIIIVAVGVILWAVNSYIPMEANIKKLLNIVVIVIMVLWILGIFGILPKLNEIPVGP